MFGSAVVLALLAATQVPSAGPTPGWAERAAVEHATGPDSRVLGQAALQAELDVLNFRLRTRPQWPHWAKVVLGFGGAVTIAGLVSLPMAFELVVVGPVSPLVFLSLAVMVVGVAIMALVIAEAFTEQAIDQAVYDATLSRRNDVAAELQRLKGQAGHSVPEGLAGGWRLAQW